MKKIIAVIAAVLFSAAVILPLKTAAASDITLRRDSNKYIYVGRYDGNGGAVTIPSKARYIAADAFKDNTKITSVIIPNGCAVEDNAFKNCVNLRSVTFSGSVPHIGKSAFSNCTSLEKVTFANNSAKIDYIDENAFMNCFKLKSVKLPENTADIRTFAFGNCISLENIIIPANTSKIGSYAAGYMYDEKSKKYFLADGETQAYIVYSEMYNGKLTEWYSPQKGEPVTILAVKKSDAEKYALAAKIPCVNYISCADPVLSVTADTKSIKVKWKDVKGADLYRISILENGVFRKYRDVTSRSCTVAGLESGTEYTFKVSVFISSRKKYIELGSTEITASTEGTISSKPKNSVPAAPKVTAESSSTAIFLKWNDVENADAYRVDIFNTETNKFESYKTVYGKSCDITELTSNTEYKVRVVSLYKIKNSFADGGASGEMSISTSRIVTG